MTQTKKCICGAEFQTALKSRLYCSNKCKQLAFDLRRSNEDRQSIINRYVRELDRELSCRGFDLFGMGGE